MYIRVVRGQTQPGRADELAERWREFVLPRLQGAPGLVHAYFGVNREADTTVGVSVWDRPPDEAAMDRVVEEFRSRIGDLVPNPPTVEGYEVAVEA